MRAIELKLQGELYEVHGLDTIRVHKVTSIRLKQLTSHSGKDRPGVVVEAGDRKEITAKIESERLNGQYGYVYYTNFIAATRVLNRYRKQGAKDRLKKLQDARKEYNDFFKKYKNEPNPIIELYP